jgi:hypothetical protein
MDFLKKKMAREVEEETTAGHRSAIIRYIILILSTSAGVLVYCVILCDIPLKSDLLVPTNW